jgi:hypothetical protein
MLGYGNIVVKGTGGTAEPFKNIRSSASGFKKQRHGGPASSLSASRGSWASASPAETLTIDIQLTFTGCGEPAAVCLDSRTLQSNDPMVSVAVTDLIAVLIYREPGLLEEVFPSVL